MKHVSTALLVLAATGFCADRVVLVEDFTNSGCGPCWSFEPTLNAFITPHLAAGDISVCRVHVNWPSASDPIYLANPTEQQARWSFYNVTGVPTIKVDGILSGYPGIEAAYATRSSVPCHLDILVARNPSSSTTGEVSIRLIAEQDLEAAAALRVFAILVEDDVNGAGYWAGSVFEQAFRDNLFGAVGPVVSFSEPYPDTVFVSTAYTLSSSWDADNLHLVTFVQEYAGAPNKEVMNADYAEFMELPTGIEADPGLASGNGCLSVTSPTVGGVFLEVALPDGVCGTVQVFDLSGRILAELPVSGTQSLQAPVAEAGIYLVRLAPDHGAPSVNSVVVLN